MPVNYLAQKTPTIEVIMKVHNVRLGFATNSSSSHSIIFAPEMTDVRDDYDVEEGFGWNYFTLASKEAKNDYMTAMLVQNLMMADGFTADLVQLILKGLGLNLNEEAQQELEQYGYCTGIDHQSLYILPNEYGTDCISVQFFKEFQAYMQKEGIIVLGGNDNTPSEHLLFSEDHQVTFDKYEPDYSGWVCRKDGQWWTLYNKTSGNRAVFSFEDNPEPFKPETPMLIDFKISNFCSKNCAYCYQGSTKQGNHVDPQKLYSFASDIADAEVFEVAIGGGEPTECPYFVDFLGYLNRLGIVSNFTTKSMDWLENEKLADKIMPLIGAFAYSADNVNDLTRIVDIFKYRRYRMDKFTVQLIPATLNKFTLKSILKFCHDNYIRVTLLGFKETGRGGKYKEIALKRNWDKFDEELWLDLVKELYQASSLPRLAIDTTLAARYLDKLKETGIPDWLYHVEEGKYSAYIDAVDMKFGPSSYHLDKLIDYEGKSANVVRNLFAKIESV